MYLHGLRESDVDIKVWNALNSVQQIIDESDTELIQFLRDKFNNETLIWSVLSNKNLLEEFKGKYTIKQVKK